MLFRSGVGHGADQTESAGVKVGKKSSFTNLVPASTIERSAAQQYAQLISQARQQQALAPNEHPDATRLRQIARKMLPYTSKWNERARKWDWEINLIGSSEINANPKDDADHEGGVWALPPTYTNKDKDRAKYQAIGESDRMTLKFVKP
mgnify:CR=1 FL=1